MIRNQRGDGIVQVVILGLILVAGMVIMAGKFMSVMKEELHKPKKPTASEQAAAKAAAAKKKIKTRFFRPAHPKEVAKQGKPYALMRGRVFDLRSAKPAVGIEVVFKDLGTGILSAVTTDAKGRYRAGLTVSNDGYQLTFERGGKAIAYLEDWTPSLSTFGEDKRHELTDDRLSQKVELETLFVGAEQRYRRDFALVRPATSPVKSAPETVIEVTPVSSDAG
jgi:hypothetical protein